MNWRPVLPPWHEPIQYPSAEEMVSRIAGKERNEARQTLEMFRATYERSGILSEPQLMTGFNDSIKLGEYDQAKWFLEKYEAIKRVTGWGEAFEFTKARKQLSEAAEVEYNSIQVKHPFDSSQSDLLSYTR